MFIATKPLAAGSNSFVFRQMQLALLAFDDDNRLLLAAFCLAISPQSLFSKVVFDKLPSEPGNGQ